MSRMTRTREAGAYAGVIALLLSAMAFLMAGLAVPAGAAEEVASGSPGRPSNECAGLDYLNKFDFTTRQFDQGATTSEQDGDVLTFTGTTDAGTVTVTFTDTDDVKSVSWTSTAYIARVWEKAGKDTDAASGSAGYEGTETVQGNAYNHITWCAGTPPPPEQPEPKVEFVYGEWEGSYECDDTQVTETRSVTRVTTPYVWDDDAEEWVLDTANAVEDELDPEENTRDLTEDEREDCPPEQPGPEVQSVFGDYVSTYECGDDEFTETRTVTTVVTPYVFDEESQEWVLDTENAVETSEESQERSREVTEADLEDCPAEVQRVVLEREPPAPAPEPEPEPAPVVLDAAKELPKTGAASDLLLIWGGVLLALGSALLLTERRMTVRRSR